MSEQQSFDISNGKIPEERKATPEEFAHFKNQRATKAGLDPSQEYTLAEIHSAERKQLEDREREKRQKIWDEKTKWVEGLADRLGHPVDEQIKQGVVAINALGFTTDGSCEGHMNWATGGPYIDIFNNRAKKFDDKYLEDKMDLSEKEKDFIDGMTLKINETDLETLYNYLEKFNKNRYFEDSRYKLTLNHHGGGSLRLESKIVDDLKIDYTKLLDIHDLEEANELNKNQEGTIMQTEEILKALQEEMNAFSKFLKQKFFENGPARVTPSNPRQQTFDLGTKN